MIHILNKHVQLPPKKNKSPNRKMGETTQFLHIHKKIQMVNKYLKRYSALLVINENNNKMF